MQNHCYCASDCAWKKSVIHKKRRSCRGQRVANWALWCWTESFGSAEGRAAHWMCREKSDTLSSSPQTPCCSDALEYGVRNWFSFIPPTLVCHAVTQSQKWFTGPLEPLRRGGTEATSSYCIWQRAHGCNLFLVRVNNFWMWRCGQAEAAVHHLGANNYFLTSVHSLSSGIHFISELQGKWQYRRRCNNRPAQGGQAFGAFSVDAFVCESPTSDVSWGCIAHSTKTQIL